MTTKKTPRATAKKTPASGEGASKRTRGGSVSTYRPEYCDIAVETLSQGHSMAGLAGRLGIARSTAFEWRKSFPEFDDACIVGMAGAVYWWEQRAMESAMRNKGNPATIIFGLKNRAADDWRDRMEHTGADGGAIVSRIELVPLK